MDNDDEAKKALRRRRIEMARELRHRGLVIQKDWLIRKITVEEAEQKNLVTNPRLSTEPVPFGYQNDTWLRVKSRMEEGAELWEFESPGDSWERLSGRAGICLVHDGWILDAVVTKMD